jgi:hypothetical protein
MNHLLAFTLVASTIGLAGCVGGDAAPAAPRHLQELGGSAESGSIHGIVVDEGLLPVARAIVTIEALDRSLVTDSAGVFGFSNVPIGDHVLLVGGAGYGTASVKVSVIAEETSHVDVTLRRIASADAYYEIKIGAGMFGCGFTYRQTITTFNGAFFGLAVCGTGASTTGLDDFTWDTMLTDKLSLLRGGAFETEWTTNQVFGNGMVQDWAVFGCANNRNATFTRDAGPSPLSEVLNAFQLDYRLKDMTENATCGGTPARERCNEVDGCHVMNRMFSWPSTFGEDAVFDVGLTIQQSFKTYLTEFYRVEPPIGFTALPDA